MKIITIFGLPGAGKGTYCKERAYKGIGYGEGCWRPEPTDDIQSLSINTPALNDTIINRFIHHDSVLQPSQYRDSDIFTSYLLFGNTPTGNPLACPPKLFIPLISDTLIWLDLDPSSLLERIVERQRPGMWRKETQYATKYWRQRAEWVVNIHPAKTKIKINPT
jgi:hypothetical protein